MPYTKDEPKSIEKLFDTIAPRYDWGNTLNSLGLHHFWNRALIQQVLQKVSPSTYLDLCCGTGAISLEYLRNKKSPPCHAYLIDFSEQMLEIAKQRLQKQPFPQHDIEIIKGDAMELPLPDQCVDAVTVAYGIRNIVNPLKALKEMARVLKPGGMVGILELTRPEKFPMKQLHRLYLKTFVPVVGKFITGDRDAYEYLKQSVHTFISPQELAGLAYQAGFNEVETIPLSFGIATLIILKKKTVL